MADGVHIIGQLVLLRAGLDINMEVAPAAVPLRQMEGLAVLAVLMKQEIAPLGRVRLLHLFHQVPVSRFRNM